MPQAVIIFIMKLHIPSDTYRTIESFLHIFDFREERQIAYFPCADGSAPLESDALLFPPPAIIAGKVREEDLYRWLRHVTLALEQEEARAMKQPSILALYLEEDLEEAAQLVLDRDVQELRDILNAADSPQTALGWLRTAIPRFDFTWFEGPRVYRDLGEED